MNRNYRRSRSREQQIKLQLQKEGYYAIRAAGSKGLADVIGIKPSRYPDPALFNIKFIQVKVSEKIKKESKEIRSMDSSCGLINIEFWKFPVKSKKWYANKRSTKIRVQSSKPTKRVAGLKRRGRV